MHTAESSCQILCLYDVIMSESGTFNATDIPVTLHKFIFHGKELAQSLKLLNHLCKLGTLDLVNFSSLVRFLFYFVPQVIKG